ncbi:SH3 domain-containing protein [Shewanella gelidii]|uniref:SH3b domain-containing protein n=1 Tax=Shewanella gelidii TaxID=1642821 RepID=A0A917JP82_9GAMM|nr:SH3 domain-containing protein [Shewanella gelidii]MCL1099211.1 SH3 domain-containing protein [Shewanella gelidii]GGI76507.1 hypothetical protein GCM10009332_12300 [Shewanella gelidii]
MAIVWQLVTKETKGFMNKALLNFITAILMLVLSPVVWSASDSNPSLKIEVPYVELRSGPSAGYPVVHVVENSEYVTVLVKRTSWLKVKDKRGIEGWFHEDDLLGLTQGGQAISNPQIDEQDFQQRNFEVGVMYGDLEGANFYNLYGSYALSSVFSTELSVGKALGNISDSDVIELMLMSQPFPEWTVIPYVGVGGGMINTTPHSVLADSESRRSTLMSAATGIKYHIARNFLLRAEYRFSLALTDRDDNEEIQTWKLGFSVFF